ncbi:MAG TPA: GNAT family N-acetyltransferase [Verrucomicrobiales bacterium]|nr:GNAT family N-acetyltransferase [Verrucomicrobiales bacterium]
MAASAAQPVCDMEACWLPDLEMGAWDRFVLAHPMGTIYHSAGWKRFLENTFSHIRGNILAIRNGTSGEILAGIPLYTARSVFLGRRVVSIPFATLGGPLVSAPWQWEPLFSSMLNYQRETGSKRLELRGIRSTAPADGAPRVPALVYLHHYLTLPKEVKDLRSEFSRTVRRELTKSQKSGIEVREDGSAEIRRIFSAMHQEARKRLGLPVYPPRFVEALSTHLPASAVSFSVAFQKDTPLGILLSFEFGDWVIAEQIAVVPEGRNLGVSHALFSHGMERAVRSGRRFYSFGRTSLEDTGLLQFKRAWGTTEEELKTFMFPEVAGGTGTPGTSLLGRLARFTFRNLPDPLARRSGEIFYRHWA